MSYLMSIVEPSGTVTVGQTITYSFAFGGPYPVNWSFDGFGYHEYGSVNDGRVITINLTVPSNPNSYPGFISSHGIGDDLNHVYYLSSLEGFPTEVRAEFQNIVSGYYYNYEYPIITPDGTSQQLNINVASGFPPFTDSTFPLTVSVTSQQIYPSLGTETTVYTYTFQTKDDLINYIYSHAELKYNTPNVVAGTIYRYKIYTTVPGGSPVLWEKGDSSVVVVSQAEKPWIISQPHQYSSTDSYRDPNNTTPYNVTLPHDGLGGEYVYLEYASHSPVTISWYRNGVPIPLDDGVHYPSYKGDGLIGNATTGSSGLTLVIPNNVWPSTCADGDSYHCTITNAYGTTTSNDVILTIGEWEPADAVTAQISPSTPIVIPAGGTISLSATSMANKSVTYQWKKDGKPISGATASTYSVVNAPSSASGAYSVVATSGTAVYETPSTQVTVKQLAYGEPNVQLGYAEIGSTITWQAIGTTDGMPGDGFTYSWQFDDGEVKIGNPVTKVGNTVSMCGTVIAIDNVTGGTATASRGIQLFKVGWNQRAAMPSIDPTSLSVTLNSSKVLLVNRGDGSSYLYDPVLDSWSSTGGLGSANNGLIGHKQLVLLPSGKALLTGLGAVPHRTTKIYDPSLGTWGDGPDMIVDSNGGAKYVALNLHDGRVFVYCYGASPIAQIYSETLNTWTRLADALAASPNTPPYMIIQLDSDRIMVMGDYGGDNQVHSVIYTISSNSWVTATTPPSFGYSSAKADLVNPGDGFIYCMGYGNGNNTTRYSAKYSIIDGSWTALAGYTGYESSANSSPMNRFLLSSGSKILIVDETYSITYDISSNTYSSPIVDYMHSTVSPAGGVVLLDGRPFTMTPNSTSCQTFDWSF